MTDIYSVLEISQKNTFDKNIQISNASTSYQFPGEVCVVMEKQTN